MSAKRRLLMSEVEDSMRRQLQNADDTAWDNSRQAYIDVAAWMLIVVENGDKRAAGQAQETNTGGDSKGAIQGPLC